LFFDHQLSEGDRGRIKKKSIEAEAARKDLRSVVLDNLEVGKAGSNRKSKTAIPRSVISRSIKPTVKVPKTQEKVITETQNAEKVAPKAPTGTSKPKISGSSLRKHIIQVLAAKPLATVAIGNKFNDISSNNEVVQVLETVAHFNRTCWNLKDDYWKEVDVNWDGYSPQEKTKVQHTLNKIKAHAEKKKEEEVVKDTSKTDVISKKEIEKADPIKKDSPNKEVVKEETKPRALQQKDKKVDSVVDTKPEKNVKEPLKLEKAKDDTKLDNLKKVENKKDVPVADAMKHDVLKEKKELLKPDQKQDGPMPQQSKKESPTQEVSKHSNKKDSPLKDSPSSVVKRESPTNKKQELEVKEDIGINESKKVEEKKNQSAVITIPHPRKLKAQEDAKKRKLEDKENSSEQKTKVQKLNGSSNDKHGTGMKKSETKLDFKFEYEFKYDEYTQLRKEIETIQKEFFDLGESWKKASDKDKPELHNKIVAMYKKYLEPVQKKKLRQSQLHGELKEIKDKVNQLESTKEVKL